MRKVFFNNFTFDRGLVSKMYSETQETIKKKNPNNPIKCGVQEFSDASSALYSHGLRVT